MRENKRLGTRLHGRYEIVSLIQKGGMGTVYLGKHLELEKNVAIKIFHPHLSEKKEMVARFVNEARGIAKLQHRNIVSVFDIGSDEDEVPYFVMEYLTGESLRERLKKTETLSIKSATDMMIQILSGLRVAHSKGIVHRDLKPGNIFLSKEEDGSEVVKILDFGVAKFREMDPDKQAEITTDGSLLGTPSYMSPEQATGKKGAVDHRSDLYTCGLILFRCLTGMNVFKGDSAVETLQNILYLDPPPPSFLNDRLPKEIDEVILKAIKRDRDERFQDCSSFIEALKSFYQIAGATPDDLVVKIVLDEGEPEEKGSRLSVSRARSDGDFTVPTISHMGGSQVRQALKPKRLLAFLFATLVVTAGLIAGWVVFFNSNREARPGAEKKADVEVRRPLEEKIEAMEHDLQESPGKEELVEIEVIGLVPGASVHVDGSKVETNPFKLEKSKDPVAVAIHYEGEVVWEKSLTPVANERLHVDIPEKKHAAKARKKPSRKKKGAKEGGTKEEPPAPPEKKEQPEKKGKRKIFKDFPE